MLREIMEKAPFGYAYHRMVYDEKGLPEDYIFLDLNPAFEEMTGLKKEAILGQRVTKVLAGIREGNFDWVEYYGHLTKNGAIGEFVRYAEPLGRWYKVKAFSPEKDHFVTIFQDITPEMERIKTLEEQAEKIKELTGELEMIFNGTQDALFLVEVDGGRFRYLRTNETHQRLTGFTMEAIQGKTPVELVGEELGKTIQDNYQKCVAAGKPITYEETLNLPSGEKTWLTRLTPIEDKGVIKYIIGSSVDITRLKQAEARLQQTLKYEQIISKLSALALQESSIEVFLDKSIGILGEGMNADRAYIFERDPEKKTISNTYEWVAPGITPQKDNLQHLSEDLYAWWTERLKNKESICYSDIDAIPDSLTKETLKIQDIKSILVVPIFLEKEYYGFIGLDVCGAGRVWTESEINLMWTVAWILSRSLLLRRTARRLWLENEKFNALVNSTDDIIFLLDTDQRHVAVYGRWMDKYGLPAEVFLGKTAREILGEENAAVHEEANKKALAGESVIYEWSTEVEGRWRYYQTSLAPLKDSEGRITGIVGVGRDITDLMETQQELWREKERLRITLSSIGDGVVTTDREGDIISLNPVAQEITGWKEEEARGRPFSEVFRLASEETGEVIEDPVGRVLATGKVVGLANHTMLITRDGHKVPIADSAAPITDEDGRIQGVVMVFRDVTAEREWEKKIIKLSYHDALTDLYNRRYVEEWLGNPLNASRLPIAVIMADVNGLKLANDVFGHAEGDRLLKTAAMVLQESSRPGDLLCRWGGDEFLLLLPHTDLNAAEEIAQKIKEKISRQSAGKIQLSIALGCGVIDDFKHYYEAIIEAEERMYRHKLIEGRSFRSAVITALLSTLYAKSAETEEHAQRIRGYSLAVGRAIGLKSKELDDLAVFAVLHDIGKVGVREEILRKPGKLAPAEWEEIKKHPEIGWRIAQNTPELAAIAEYILYHHERWDGRGYPAGLKGEEIPLLCRILAVADAFDAMTSDRPYRRAMTCEEAIKELEKGAGSQFDPAIVAVFLSHLREIDCRQNTL